MLKKTFEVLKKYFYIFFIHMVYSASIIFVLLNSKNLFRLDLDKLVDQLTDIQFIMNFVLGLAVRGLILFLISAVFLSVLYYLIAKGIKEEKIDMKSGLITILKYAVFNFLSFILWIPLITIYLASIGVISVPSVLIAIPLLYYGKEYLFIPAIILWMVTIILILFSVFLYSLYLTFWYPAIYLSTGNIFAAYGRANKVVNGNYWRLLLYAILNLSGVGVFTATIVRGYILISQNRNMFGSGLFWGAVIIMGVLGTLLKVYAFVFFDKKYMDKKNYKDKEKNILESQ